MDVLDMPLFASQQPIHSGIGFHNVGSGVLRASDIVTIKKIEAHYGARCGHIPLDAEIVYVLVQEHTPAMRRHMAYLGHLFGKDVQPVTAIELQSRSRSARAERTLVVPYVNVPEAEQWIQHELQAEAWGIVGDIVTLLKNKADFYQLLDELAIDGLHTPDYRIAHIANLAQSASDFLGLIEGILKAAGMTHYPLGIMLRAAESDGNYGCCLLYEKNQRVCMVQDGDAEHVLSYASWQQALLIAQQHLASTMNPQKEARVVMSRFLDLLDSPGMSVVVLDGQVISLGWNGQLQKEGSKACVGTGTYHPKDAHLARLQQIYEAPMAARFEELLRKTAARCGVDFATLRGVANLDIMLPGPLEVRLQQQRGQAPTLFIAECNPRWTNYTDAIMTIIGVQRQAGTIRNMQAVIQRGIQTVDKYALPQYCDPEVVRACIAQRDAMLQRDGVRIICRMANNPMGIIFAGDVSRAQQELAAIVYDLVARQA